ncbi:MAG: hypothetical protein ACK5K7_07585 [Bacilli bacterium]
MKKKIIISIVTICLISGGSFFFHFSSMKNNISALGYSDTEVDKFIDEHGVFNAYKEVETALNDEIETKEDTLNNEIGVSPDLITDKDDMTRVEYSTTLDDFIVENTELYSASIQEIDAEITKYPTEEKIDTADLTLYDEFTLKTEFLSKLETEFSNKLEEHKTALLDYGMRESELEGLLTGDVLADLEALGNKLAYYKEYQALVSTSGNSYASGAMDLFNILNNHRISKGLAPFTYNSEQQGCVDIEANSYANNKNPHNWLCKSLTSEGASLASVSSDYIQIAGNFLTTHASHEADVINPNYTSAACSAVQRDGMVYMICGYFQ